MLSEKRIKTICKIGQEHACCRYLLCGADGFLCGKMNPHLKEQLDDRVKRKDMVARGDNCDGVM